MSIPKIISPSTSIYTRDGNVPPETEGIRVISSLRVAGGLLPGTCSLGTSGHTSVLFVTDCAVSDALTMDLTLRSATETVFFLLFCELVYRALNQVVRFLDAGELAPFSLEKGFQNPELLTNS